MFNSMKNQFREKTGKDLPKFTPQKGGLSRQSRQGSESSICSLVLENTQQQSQSQSQSSTAAVIPVTTQDVHPLKLSDGKVLSNKEINILAKKEEEWRHRLEKKEVELNKKWENRESDLLQELALKSEEWRKKEHELTQDLLKQTNEVKAAIKLAEEYKRKICQYQEDKDQLEGFQTQEMAKVKHLLLAKEKENNEMAATLKENLALIETLKAEVSRLRPFEEKISNFEDDLEILRHTSEKERWFLSSKLAQSEEQVRHLTDRVAVLTRRSESDAGLASSLPPDDRVQALLGERALLERRLEEAHVHLTDIKASWSAQIASLETQVGRLSRQAGEEGAERRTAEAKLAELEAKLEEELKEKHRLITRINTLTEECDTLAAELKSTNNLIEIKQNENADILNKLKDLEQSLQEKENERAQWEAEVSNEREKRENCEVALVSVKECSESELNKLQSSLNKEKTRNEELRREIDKERTAKDDALLRNAQISQETDIIRQNLREQQTEAEEQSRRIIFLEGIHSNKEQELAKLKTDISELTLQFRQLQEELEAQKLQQIEEEKLKSNLTRLEEELFEKNKAIRVLQQKLADMKKTLQRELKVTDNGSSTEVISNHNTITGQSITNKTNGDNEVNFLYLKHVIMKFLTSREYEALHLTKAVATLLKLSAEEECLLKDTIDWKMSWFRSKPRLEDYSPR
uniref:Putative golgin subfamily protein a member 1 n=1 Tax=Panstrongylus lignarius TaxID=156445 RepID=A0A224XJM3_9HEMI